MLQNKKHADTRLPMVRLRLSKLLRLPQTRELKLKKHLLMVHSQFQLMLVLMYSITTQVELSLHQTVALILTMPSLWLDGVLIQELEISTSLKTHGVHLTERKDTLESRLQVELDSVPLTLNHTIQLQTE